jgi:hypothetical protein
MEDLDFSKIKQSPLTETERRNIVTALNQGVDLNGKIVIL